MKRSTAAALIAAATVLTLMTACSKKYKEVDLSSRTTEAPATTAATAAPTTAAPETLPPVETTEAVVAGKDNVKTSIKAYTNNKVKVCYPVVSGLSDTAKLDALNSRLKDNALSFLDAWDLDESKDTVEVTCKVISADRNRIVVSYNGYVDVAQAAHPSNIFYTNTVDIASMKDIGLSDYMDSYTMAGYVKSKDLKLAETDEEIKKAFDEYREDLDVGDLDKIFSGADFPMDKDFPESFSYTKNGDIYFSIPVPHAMGDYVIAIFEPDAK